MSLETIERKPANPRGNANREQSAHRINLFPSSFESQTNENTLHTLKDIQQDEIEEISNVQISSRVCSEQVLIYPQDLLESLPTPKLDSNLSEDNIVEISSESQNMFINQLLQSVVNNKVPAEIQQEPSNPRSNKFLSIDESFIQTQNEKISFTLSRALDNPRKQSDQYNLIQTKSCVLIQNESNVPEKNLLKDQNCLISYSGSHVFQSSNVTVKRNKLNDELENQERYTFVADEFSIRNLADPRCKLVFDVDSGAKSGIDRQLSVPRKYCELFKEVDIESSQISEEIINDCEIGSVSIPVYHQSNYLESVEAVNGNDRDFADPRKQNRVENGEQNIENQCYERVKADPKDKDELCDQVTRNKTISSSLRHLANPKSIIKQTSGSENETASATTTAAESDVYLINYEKAQFDCDSSEPENDSQDSISFESYSDNILRPAANPHSNMITSHKLEDKTHKLLQNNNVSVKATKKKKKIITTSKQVDLIQKRTFPSEYSKRIKLLTSKLMFEVELSQKERLKVPSKKKRRRRGKKLICSNCSAQFLPHALDVERETLNNCIICKNASQFINYNLNLHKAIDGRQRKQKEVKYFINEKQHNLEIVMEKSLESSIQNSQIYETRMDAGDCSQKHKKYVPSPTWCSACAFALNQLVIKQQ